MSAPDSIRRIPSVASFLKHPDVRVLLSRHPRAVVVAAVRRLLDLRREEVMRGEGTGRTRDDFISRLVAALPAEVAAAERISLRRVINATGVVIHTNLGRAPLAEEALRAISETAAGYSNLEFDLAEGTRSRRLAHVEAMLLALTGAESVHVVNNNAAAVFLCVAALAAGREVIVSRGELVEIGGSFRIPDILAAGGARLVEVGTTNRTRLPDYERAIGSATALLLKVHRSNFRITGFTEEVPANALAALGEDRGIPVMEDLGSGAVFDFAKAGIPGTPTIRQALEQGPGIVTVSGDKLLGGPQAGIIAGRKDLVDPLKRHPLSRALRIDKLCLAALAATLLLYSDERTASSRIPVLSMVLAGRDAARSRARRLVAKVRREQARCGGAHDFASGIGGLAVSIEDSVSSPGGGAMPEVDIPTACVAVSHSRIRTEELEERLRTGVRPVVGRVAKGRLFLDLRTVGEGEVGAVAEALAAAVDGAPPPHRD